MARGFLAVQNVIASNMLDNKTAADSLYFLWTPSINNWRCNISRDEEAFIVMVSHNVVGCSSENWSKCNNLTDFIGFWSYKTAWTWLQKLRRALVRTGRDKLTGIVEVDEAFIGGMEIGKGKQGRSAETKTLVVVATESNGKQIGRVRFKCISDASGENLIGFIEENIEFGSKIISDSWSGYSSLSKSEKYEHEAKIISESGKEAHELLPHVHLVYSLVKRWINGTHQGKVLPKNLPHYLDEYAFRFNRRLSTYRGKFFYRLVQQAVDTSRQFHLMK